jgi:putative selenium metabolism protein SsnA
MLLIGNGLLVTRNGQDPLIENGCVCVKDGYIHDYGTTELMRSKYKYADYFNCSGQIIHPGLINTHHHIYSAFARGLNMPGYTPENFLEILEQMWWKLDNNLSLDNTLFSAYVTYLDCIKNGVTTVIDHHASYNSIEGSLFTISEAATALGIRTSLAFEVSDRHGEEKMKTAVRENVDFIKNNKNNPMLCGLFGLHAPFTLSDPTLFYCQSMIPGNAGYHVHIAEGIEDVDICLEKYGATPVGHLNQFHLFNEKSIAVHCIHNTEEDIDILSNYDTMVVHNPESNMGNHVGTANISAFLKRNILTGLGTDGYSSNMLESYKVTNCLQKHAFGPQKGFAESNKLLFENNGAIASRVFNTPVGIIDKGYVADIIVVDYIPPTPINENNINGHFLFGITGDMTTSTFINGKQVMKNKQITTVDTNMIYAKSRESANELWRRLEETNE